MGNSQHETLVMIAKSTATWQFTRSVKSAVPYSGDIGLNLVINELVRHEPRQTDGLSQLWSCSV